MSVILFSGTESARKDWIDNMKNRIKTAFVCAVAVSVLALASCGGRVGEDVIDGDEYSENLNDGITSDEEIYNGPAGIMDMSPDSANIVK